MVINPFVAIYLAYDYDNCYICNKKQEKYHVE